VEKISIPRFFKISIAGHSLFFFIIVGAYGGMSLSGGPWLFNFTLITCAVWCFQLLVDFVVLKLVKETRRVLVRTLFMLLEGWVWLFWGSAMSLLFYFFSPHETSALKIVVVIWMIGLFAVVLSELMRVHNAMKIIGFDKDFKEGEHEVVFLWKKRGFVTARKTSTIARWNSNALNFIMIFVAPIGMGGVVIATHLLVNATGPMVICFLLAILATPIAYTFWSHAAINLYVNLYKILQVELRTGKPVVYDKYPDVFRGLIGSDEF